MALAYRDTLIRESRFTWGLDAPVPVMAAQMQQESHWDPAICSAYACGLAQFTPATARWISKAYPGLETGDVFNIGWAIRALVVYDHHLYERVPPAATDCDRWAFALSSYNGGLGWLQRDVRMTVRAGKNGKIWAGNVALYSPRGKAAKVENRGYPRKILNNEATYAGWGRSLSCTRL